MSVSFLFFLFVTMVQSTLMQRGMATGNKLLCFLQYGKQQTKHKAEADQA